MVIVDTSVLPATSPVAEIVPVTLAPVAVTTNTFATPLTEVLTLPSATGIDTDDVLLAIPEIVEDPDNILVHDGVAGVPMFSLISDTLGSYQN